MKLLKLFIAVVIFGSMAAPASAVDGTINFTGRIVNGTCSVGAGTSPLEVTLDNVLATDLSKKDATAGAKPFQIDLTKCGLIGAKTVKAKFEGLGKDNLLAITGGAGKASNVGIGIYNDDDDTQIPAGKFSKSMHVGLGTEGTLKFKAKYVATGVATAGAVQATTTFTLHYE
ncbi:fimbrial protein [Xenorhabdus nematophila]|uniref:fimbrial protein n=1 Tax=Xenorhabdus nematophila TaxID=628 RepID=UPI0032B87B75